MQVYVDGISDDNTEQDLTPLFAGVHSMKAVRVIRDIVSGESRGFALVTVSDEAEGQEAVARLNGATLSGRKLTIFKVHDTLPGEMEFREWMRDNADGLLRRVGIRDSQTVVDYGCGPGIFSIASGKIAGPLGKVYALDVRPRALEGIKDAAAAEGLANVETMLLDKSAVSASLDSGIADVVLLFDVLQEITDKPALIREMDRLLKPEGVLSVFPMHLGTDRLLELVDTTGIFKVRDCVGYPGFQSASEIINLTKRSRAS